MLNIETTISTPIKVPFVSENNDTGISNFDTIILKDGDIYTSLVVPTSYMEIGEGLYTINMTFTESGVYTLFVENAIVAYIEVKERSTLSYLVNLEDAAIGSWLWNKQTNNLQLFRINGQVLAEFSMNDSTLTASREII
jgi:hypothetical protein